MQIIEHSSSVLRIGKEEHSPPSSRKCLRTVVLTALPFYFLLFLLPFLQDESVRLHCVHMQEGAVSCTIAVSGMDKGINRIRHPFREDIYEAEYIFSAKAAIQGNSRSLLLATEMGDISVPCYDPEELVQKMNDYLHICAKKPNPPPSYTWTDSSSRQAMYQLWSILFLTGGTIVVAFLLFVKKPVLCTFDKQQWVMRIQYHSMLRCSEKEYDLSGVQEAGVSYSSKKEAQRYMHLWYKCKKDTPGQQVPLMRSEADEARRMSRVINEFLGIDTQERVKEVGRNRCRRAFGCPLFLFFIFIGLSLFFGAVFMLLKGDWDAVGLLLFSCVWTSFTLFIAWLDGLFITS